MAQVAFARLFPGDAIYWVVFPTGTKREEQLPPLPYARRYRITLPDGSIFDENYYLDFHQSLIASASDVSFALTSALAVCSRSLF